MTGKPWLSASWLRACALACVLAGFASAALVGWVPAALADPVTVRTTPNAGFGRIAFGWPAPVGHTADLRNNTLTLTFDRPVQVDLSRLAAAFPGYLEAARLSPDGRSVVLELTKHFLYRSYPSGTEVLVDLLGQGIEVAAAAPPAAVAVPRATPTPAPAQQAATPPAATAPRPAATPAPAPTTAPATAAPATAIQGPARVGTAPVPLRIGSHDGYDRIVFDWTVDVQYTAEGGDGRITIDFARGDGTDLTPLTRGGLPSVQRATASVANGHTLVVLDVPPGARLRHFRSDTKVVVDVLDAATAATTPAAPAQTAARTTPAPTVTAQAAPRATPAAPATATPIPPAAATPRPATPAPAATRPGIGEPVAVTFSAPDRGTGRIAFKWPRVAGMAAFLRAGYLWVVFDGVGNPTMPAIPEELSGVLSLAERVPADGATAFRFQVGEGFFPAITRTDQTWTIDLLPDPPPLARPVDILRQSSADVGAVVVLALAESTGAFQVRDPEVGDILDVIPVRTARHGMAETHSFVQFRLLQTSQGAVVERLDDRIKVAAFANGATITGGGGLVVTPVANGTRLTAGVPVQRADAATGPPPRPKPELLKLAEWHEAPQPLFYDNVKALQYAVAVAEPEARTEGRLRLAGYYLANQFYPEASGVLAFAAEMDLGLMDNLQFRAMRGFAQLRQGHTKDAAVDLLLGTFDGNPEIAAWRGVMFAMDRNWPTAKFAFGVAGDIYQGYPPVIATEVALWKGQTALTSVDMPMLQSVIAGLETSPPPEGHKLVVQADLLRAQAYAFIDAIPDALRLYNTVVDSSVLPYSAQSRLYRSQLLVKTKGATPEAAAADLDKLRFVWRGDDFEFRLLVELGNLYLQFKDYRNGLTALRQVVSLYPDLSRTEGIAQRMNTVFADLFLRGESEQLVPVSALALYYDFRELTPVGIDGDEMVRRLADRLFSVDLLQQAAELLEYQVQFRLRAGSEDKATIAARLAAIYLFARQPQKALETLTVSRTRSTNEVLNRDRAQLEARALAELKRFDEALAVLASDNSRDGLLLRGDVQWRAQNWTAAARSFDTYLGDAWRNDTVLTVDDRRQVLRTGVSLVLANDKVGLTRLRDRYHTKMSTTPDGDAFDIITDQTNPGTISFREVAAKVAQIDTLDSFRQSYLGRVKSGQVAAIN